MKIQQRTQSKSQFIIGWNVFMTLTISLLI